MIFKVNIWAFSKMQNKACGLAWSVDTIPKSISSSLALSLHEIFFFSCTLHDFFHPLGLHLQHFQKSNGQPVTDV
jgi:hypothetical protein